MSGLYLSLGLVLADRIVQESYCQDRAKYNPGHSQYVPFSIRACEGQSESQRKRAKYAVGKGSWQDEEA